MAPLITLTTDFGLMDPYVAEMKGVILDINPDANIVDVSHDIRKFDIRMAAYTLACATPYFPRGTVHMAVVDPHVGTRRRPVLIQTQNAFYVGPDNGTLPLAANNQRIKHVFEISNRKFMLSRISNTFHGRDIFAPAAAHLSNGIRPAAFGPEIRRISTLGFARIIRRKHAYRRSTSHGQFRKHNNKFPRKRTRLDEHKEHSWYQTWNTQTETQALRGLWRCTRKGGSCRGWKPQLSGNICESGQCRNSF